MLLNKVNLTVIDNFKSKIMKTLFYITALLLTSVIFGQEGVEVPLSTYVDVPNGTYIKDIQNVFQPYIGTWKGVTSDNKEFTLQLVKFTKHLSSYPNGSYYYRDELVGKYQLKDLTTGSIISNTLSAVNYEDYRIYVLGRPINSVLDLIFIDTTLCNNSLRIYIKDIPGSPNQLRYSSFYDTYSSYDCPYANQTEIPLPIPGARKVVTLTKQ